MPRKRDPNFKTGHLCRFCGQLGPWGTILRLIRVDPDTPAFMLSESGCHTECLRGQPRPDVEGGAPMLDDAAEVAGRPCARCGKPITPAALVRLRVQRPAGTVKAPEF